MDAYTNFIIKHRKLIITVFASGCSDLLPFVPDL